MLGAIGGRQEQDAQVLLERRDHHAIVAGGSGREELAQLRDGLLARAILERGLVDVEDQVGRSGRAGGDCGRDRELGDSLRSEGAGGAGRPARRGAAKYSIATGRPSTRSSKSSRPRSRTRLSLRSPVGHDDQFASAISSSTNVVD